MTDTLGLAAGNLLSPAVLCFFLGGIATLAKSDLKIPEAVSSLLTTYLLLAIGLKGGVEISHASASELAWPLVATLAVGLVTPLAAIAVARGLGKLGIADAAALGAHYGSVSIVTFIAVTSFLQATHLPVPGYVTALVVLLEVPGLLLSLVIARFFLSKGQGAAPQSAFGSVLREILSGRSLVLMLGGLAIGALCGKEGFARVEPFFGPPFQGVVALFLLEMGLLAARRLRDLRKVGMFVLSFATLMPVLNACFGIAVARVTGLPLGAAIVLGTLAASASYIAAPAAVRLALPEANPGIYLNAALTVTFPFNLTLGIPLYSALAKMLYEVWP
ncbi:MAG: sodium-dependent bicarbonate transport family permease [Silvanigrellales bacterium]|nr:sodium-dependent bicarbonate transport family permease [Silvanigrellales bacterium]